MKTLKAYLYGELTPEARTAADAGAYLYAAGMLLQNNNCPPHMVAKMHQTFLDEYLGGYFDLSGMCRFPANALKDPKADTVTAAPLAEVPKADPEPFGVIEGEKQ